MVGGEEEGLKRGKGTGSVLIATDRHTTTSNKPTKRTNQPSQSIDHAPRRPRAPSRCPGALPPLRRETGWPARARGWRRRPVYIKSYGFLMYGGYVFGREGLVGISLSMCIIDLCHTPSMCNVQITIQNQRGKNGPWTRSPRSACRAGGAAAWQSRRRRHRPPHMPG